VDNDDYPRIGVILLPDNDFDRGPGPGEKRHSHVKAPNCLVAWRFREARYASTPRESNAPGPDHKLISVPEDGHDHGGLNALLADVERTGASVTITKHGRPVAVLIPTHQGRRRFVQLPALAAADT
jgi:hypothetical protein